MDVYECQIVCLTKIVRLTKIVCLTKLFCLTKVSNCFCSHFEYDSQINTLNHAWLYTARVKKDNYRLFLLRVVNKTVTSLTPFLIWICMSIKKYFLVCSYNFLLCHSIVATNFLLPTPPDKASLVLQNKISSSHSARQGQSCASKQNSFFFFLIVPFVCFFEQKACPLQNCSCTLKTKNRCVVLFETGGVNNENGSKTKQ